MCMQAAFDPVNAPDVVEGHAFGVLHSGDLGIIMEGTIWDYTSDDARPPPEPLATLVHKAYKASEARAIKALEKGDVAQSSEVSTRKMMSSDIYHKTYRRIFTAGDCILFEAGAKRFGVCAASLNSALPITNRILRHAPFRITLLDLVEGVGRGDRGWPYDAEAAQMHALLLSASRSMPAFVATLRPPPQPEEALMKRTGTWAPFYEADLPKQTRPTTCAFAFGTVVGSDTPPELTAALKAGLQAGRLASHACMHSTLYRTVDAPS